MSPPGVTPTSDSNLTDLRTSTRDRRAEARKHRRPARSLLEQRIARKARLLGHEPMRWQVQSIAETLEADGDAPSDEQIIRELMAAPWFPKARRRHWRVGERGGWAVRS